MISQKLQTAINDQLNAELYSAYLYLSMSAYLSSKHYPGAAQWMRVQVKEETQHAMKFYDYLVNSAVRVQLKAIEAPQTEWDGLAAVFEHTVEHEKKVTGLITALMDLAKAEGERQAQEFLQWYVDEQEEEEEHTQGVLEKVRALGDGLEALAKLDAELGKRE